MLFVIPKSKQPTEKRENIESGFKLKKKKQINLQNRKNNVKL